MFSWEWRTVASVASACVAALMLSCGNDVVVPNGGPAGSGADGGSPTGAGGVPGAGNTSIGGTSPGGSNPGGSGGSGGVVPTVTWSDDIAPIVYRECAGCHRDGGIAPFSLLTYADARPFARGAMVAVAERYMPPMPVDNSGDCNTYANARWLTDDEIELFAQWVDQGVAEGDPSHLPPPPASPAGLDRVDVTLSMPMEYTPNAAVTDDYRCFVVDPGVEDSYLVAYETLPGDARVVHHAIVFQPQKDSDAADAEALDAAEEGPGYTCYGAPRIDADPLAIWAPGGGPAKFPAGTGILLSGGRKLVLQMHYNTGSGVYPDKTSVRLQLEQRVDHPAYFQPIADQDMSVMPGQQLGMTVRTFPVKTPAPGTAYGVAPHMHTLGRTLRVDASFADGTDRCLVNVDRWNFHWQNAWWYTNPIKGTAESVTISCGYDTTGRTTPVTWGEGTNDEMCLAYLYIATP